MPYDRDGKKRYTYRIVDQDYRITWSDSYKTALKIQRDMYRNGSERVQIAKEYLS